MDDLKRELITLGFSAKEADVYLAALQLGRSGVNQIARLSKVNRATTYSVLDSLSSRSLVMISCENGERQFSAEPPERILSILQLQQQELSSRYNCAENLVDRLKTFYNNNNEKPKIRYIENLDGLRQMQREYENREGEIIQIVGYDTFLNLHGEEINNDHQRELTKMKKKIRSILVTDSQVSFPKELAIEFVTVSPALMKIDGEMSVCGDRLILFSYSNGIIAIEIVSQTIADTARGALELAWRQAQQLAMQKSNS